MCLARGDGQRVAVHGELLYQRCECRRQAVQSCWNGRHENGAIPGIAPLIRIEIGQPTKKQRTVVAPHQFIPDAGQTAQDSLSFRPAPTLLVAPFPPHDCALAAAADGERVLVLLVSAHVRFDIFCLQHAFRQRNGKANRPPVGDVEVGIVVLKQLLNASAEPPVVVHVAPVHTRHIGAAGAGSRILERVV